MTCELETLCTATHTGHTTCCSYSFFFCLPPLAFFLASPLLAAGFAAPAAAALAPPFGFASAAAGFLGSAAAAACLGLAAATGVPFLTEVHLEPPPCLRPHSSSPRLV